MKLPYVARVGLAAHWPDFQATAVVILDFITTVLDYYLVNSNSSYLSALNSYPKN